MMPDMGGTFDGGGLEHLSASMCQACVGPGT